MPAFLAPVPLHLPLDAPLPRQCAQAMPLLEAIEQRARAQDVAVDARVGRGRTYRDALRRMLDEEQVDRVIVSADRERPRRPLRRRPGVAAREGPAEVLDPAPGPRGPPPGHRRRRRGHF